MASGQGQPLGDYVVSFSTSGIDLVQQGMAGIGAGLEAMQREVQTWTSGWQRAAADISSSLGAVMDQQPMVRSAQGLGVLRTALGGLGISMEDLDAQARQLGQDLDFRTLAGQGIAALNEPMGKASQDFRMLIQLLEGLGPAGRATAAALRQVGESTAGMGQSIAAAMERVKTLQSARGLDVLTRGMANLQVPMSQLDDLAAAASNGTASFQELASRGLAALDQPAGKASQDFRKLLDLLESLGPAGQAVAANLRQVGDQTAGMGQAIAGAMERITRLKSGQGLEVLTRSLGNLDVPMARLDQLARAATNGTASFQELASRGLAALDQPAGKASQDFKNLIDLLEGLGPAGQATAAALRQVGDQTAGMGQAIGQAMDKVRNLKSGQGLEVLTKGLAGLQVPMDQLDQMATVVSARSRSFQDLAGQVARGATSFQQLAAAAGNGSTSFQELASRGLAQLNQPAGTLRRQLGQLILVLRASGAAGRQLADDLIRLAGGSVRTSQGLLTLSVAERLKGGFAGLGTAIQGTGAVLAPMVGYVQGWVHAGINASSAGQVLTLQFEELSRQIASIFAPTIQAAIRHIGDLISWFRNLSAEQQATLRHLGLFALGLTTTAHILPQLIASGRALVTVFGGLRLGLTALTAHPLVLLATVVAGLVIATTDWKEVLVTIGNAGTVVGNELTVIFRDLKVVIDDVLTVTRHLGEALGNMKLSQDLQDWMKNGGYTNSRNSVAFARRGFEEAGAPRAGQHAQTLLAGSLLAHPGLQMASHGFQRALAALFGKIQEVREVQSIIKKPGHQLEPRLGGFEAVEHAYRRIAEASIKTTAGIKTPQQETVDLLKDIYKHVEQLHTRIDEIRPPVR